MKKIFMVYIKQTFQVYEQWFWSKKRRDESTQTVCGMGSYTIANTPEEAIEKYKAFHPVEYDHIIDDNIYVNDYKYNYDNIQCEVLAKEAQLNLDELRKKLPAGDFLEYCKEYMIPMENIFKS